MKYILKLLTVFTVVFFTSCEDKLTDLSIDPDDLTIANDSEVLTAAQGYIAIMQDVYLNEDSFLWAQYYTWGIGVSIGNQERYVAEPDDHDTYWRMAYADALQDLQYLSKSESPAYRGVAGILRVYVFQALVDHFGDIPYSEANQGELSDGGVVAPKFDDAASIYADLIVSLDNSLTELATASNDIGSDDVIYGGDLDKWVRFANTLKLRILMRTSEVDPKGDEIIALIASGTFIEAGDLAEVQWSGVTGNENPMFATQSSGVGDFYFASNTSLNAMVDDPRVSFFYGVATTGPNAGTIAGIEQGAIDRDVAFTDPSSDFSGSSAYANGPAVSTILMSPWESWFLRAEADARYGTADNDVVAFNNAIQTNFDHIGATGAIDFIADLDYSGAGSLDAKLDLIAMQKWISFNGTQEDEGWLEALRLDRSVSRLFTDGIWQTPPLSVLPAGSFPESWLYPASELSFNASNAPSQRVITDRLFWNN